MDNQLKPQQDSAAGVKYDKDKLRYDLISPYALEGLVKILTFGANKYAARNWEKGINYSRVFGALMRHLWAWWRGESIDPETGESHLHHAACCIMFLQHYDSDSVKYVEMDDRPSTVTLFEEKKARAKEHVKDIRFAENLSRTAKVEPIRDALGTFMRCPICGTKTYIPKEFDLTLLTTVQCECGITLKNM